MCSGGEMTTLLQAEPVSLGNTMRFLDLSTYLDMQCHQALAKEGNCKSFCSLGILRDRSRCKKCYISKLHNLTSAGIR